MERMETIAFSKKINEVFEMKEMSNWLEKRVELSEVVPLDIPISIKVEPTNICNFKCTYCIHAVGGGGWRR